MRLVSCHIENFGRLHDESFDFTPGKNVIFEENGWGKSTLAAFINVMFYGFSGEGKRSDIENGRKRYMPWQGGIYGGQLCFQTDDKEYRIERIFGTKKSGTDSFQLYDNKTNLVSSDHTVNIGEEIFGIDSESFRRTVFIAQQDCGTLVTAGINAKIGNVADETADMGNYETVQARLKKELDRLNPERSTGEINRLQKEIADLKTGVLRKDSQQETLNQLKQRLSQQQTVKQEKLSEQKSLLDKQLKLSSYKDKKALSEKYDEIIKAEKEAYEAVRETEKFFGGAVPEPGSIDGQMKDLKLMLQQEQSAENFSPDPGEQERFRSLQTEFRAGLPAADDLDRADRCLAELEDLQDRISAERLSDDEDRRLMQAKKMFASYVPTQEETDKLTDAWNDRAGRKAALSSKKANADFLRSAAAEKKKSTPALPGRVLLITGLVLAAAGLVMFVLSYRIPGIIAAAAGIAALITGLLSGRSGRGSGCENNNNDTAFTALENDIAEDERAVSRAEDDVKKMFSALGIPYSEIEVNPKLLEIKLKLRDYEELLPKAERYSRNDYNEAASKKTAELEAFINRYLPYSAESSYASALAQLKNDASEYSRLGKMLENRQKAQAEADRYRRTAEGFISSMNILPGHDLLQQMTEIRDRALLLDRQRKIYAQQHDARMQFEKDHDAAELRRSATDMEDESLEAVTAQLAALKSELDHVSEIEAGCRRQINDAEEIMNQTESDEEELSGLQEHLKELQHRYDIISTTRDCLEKAKINFSARYMDPIKKAFDKYYGMIAQGDDGRIYELDANLNISLKESGKLHDTDLLSEGCRDMVGLCRRMAMTDAMYGQERPFLVFDDPFVNLDDRHLNGAVHFLENVAESYQVLYFVCSRGRI